MKRKIICLSLLAATTIAPGIRALAHSTEPQPIRPMRIEVGFSKTVHILFPSPVTYIDIGSMNIIAGKADGAENVVRVKAAVKDFAAETNLTIITEDGGFYTFDASYAENPAISTVEIEAPATPAAAAAEPLRPTLRSCLRNSANSAFGYALTTCTRMRLSMKSFP